ncbi:hypothetical protein FDECE_11427 [Fusarium decemcellulare]|nr:hypothetical protein FDECE_11427 [Fusarium decemcellulare]
MQLASISLLLANFAAMLMAYLYGSGYDLHRTKESFLHVFSHRHEPADYSCEYALIQPQFLSFEPIMVYIENFLTPFETAYLKQKAELTYDASLVYRGDEEWEVDRSIRDSESSYLYSPDPVVDCVRQRAARFQGFASNESIDPLSALRYTPGGHLNFHFDWNNYTVRPAGTTDRRTTYFVTLDDGCVGGSTYFPWVQRPVWGDRKAWCGWIECDDRPGLAIRPVSGNAVFWVNYHDNGTGVASTWHAGEPVIEGVKIGLEKHQ